MGIRTRIRRAFGAIAGVVTQTPANSPRYQQRTFKALHEHIMEVRPDLAVEFTALYHQPIERVGAFLDTNFPVPEGWGSKDIATSPQALRQAYPKDRNPDANDTVLLPTRN